MNIPHPNEPLLEALLLTGDDNAKEHSQLLEHLLVQASDNKDSQEALMEAGLVLADQNTKDIIQAIKDIPKTEIPEAKEFPEIKIPEFPSEIKVSNQIDTKTLEDKISAVEQAIREREDKEVDLSPVVDILKEMRDREIPEVDSVEYPDMSGKLDELIRAVKESNVESSDDVDYTEKFNELIKEIKNKKEFSGLGVMGSGSVEIMNRSKAQINPATEENQTNGSQRTIHVDSKNNEIIQTLTAFGDNRVAELSPQIQQSFDYTVSNTDLNEIIVTGSATVTQVTALAKVSSGTTAGSIGRLKGAHHCKYRAGLGGLARFSGMFTAPVAGTEQYIGIMDEAGVSADFLNGFAIGYRGTTMTVARWQNDVLFEVVRSAWDDPLDGTGSSGLNIDFTKLNPFDIQYQYLGAGPIRFFVENPNTGVPYCFHIIKYGNINITPSTYNPNYHFQMYVDNVATTSDLSVYCGSYGFFVEGKTSFIEIHQPQFSSQNRQKTAVTTEVAIFTIRNKSTYAGKVNYIDITPKRFSASIEAASANNLGGIRMVKNATLGGTPVWTDINTTNSVMDIDVAGTTVTGGTQLIGTFLAGKNDKHFEALTDYDIIIHPGETLTFAASSVASATINVVCFWKELV